MSVAGGVAVSYVFFHLLPQLNDYQQRVEGSINGEIGNYFENHIYLIALLGLVIFYGLERMVKKSKKKQKRGSICGGILDPYLFLFCL
ncbi:hypothetical protein [Bacillus sp. V5-8f]|uniref:hypothetical protein n=1 Tax=Bacillus sp. V5-8f TaxID=2053044 RepID=UPI0021552D8E|nr:hypothetical protein [Bacillus sp. V5-8f]